ncbi:Phosphate uptake regulator [Halalkaliarchaeum sp. AArc-CO]|uniref:phosphate signaling complex PhoU family protein n=1 Tax=unclassified Halalkaliarchaeum TaxID=2678344 RepID=UPI00217EFE03|nr:MULTISPECIES: phosphate uptake regulator PhoU [unclassified Halalkaliarchaeum]MDR5672208.1 phosphate uptake regulator PhoU [Halalkaliarchaeum sp. AArc-GB]UWG51714.1 Phosphate uptake regulator [Halalkaliarchaeum sp. AArc-CO]
MKNGVDPIERKIQRTGGSTYTVSLPKEWAMSQEIESGSIVRCFAYADRLVITRKQDRGDRGTVRLDAGEVEQYDLESTIAAAYVSGCDAVRIDGVVSAGVRREIRDAVDRLIGFEIDEEGDGTVIARAMLASGNLPPERALMRMEMTALSMHEDAIEAVLNSNGDTAVDVRAADHDVDRLFALLARRFQRSEARVAERSRDGDSRLTPFDYYTAARQIERIADHAEKIAGTIERIDGPVEGSTADRIRILGKRSRDVTRTALSGLFEGDHAELRSAAAAADAIADDAEQLDRELYELDPEQGYHLGIVLDSVIRTARYGANVAEAGLQAAMRHRQK